MGKLIEIQGCYSCQYYTFLPGGYRCTKMKDKKYEDGRKYGKWIDTRIFERVNTPEWCPLQDSSIIDAYFMTDADGMPEHKRGEL